MTWDLAPYGAHERELADLRHVPLGNALFTRDSFAAEYGDPELVGPVRQVDLEGENPEYRCLYCDGERFDVEVYATDRADTRVVFWWCQVCCLGRAVSVGSIDGQVLPLDVDGNITTVERPDDV